MLIKEVGKHTKLTKKAIEYYTSQGLIFPTILDNGYRDYSSQDIENLKKISVLRKLDIPIGEIKHIFNDKTSNTLQTICIKRKLQYQQDTIKKSMIQKLSEGKPYSEVEIELQSIEQEKTILNRLLDTFPGYYGRFICMHFARFLQEPITSKSQQSAYETIITFLDNLPIIDFPDDLKDYIMACSSDIGINQMTEILENTKKAYNNPDEYLRDNKEAIEQYLQFKNSEEYKNSPIYQLSEIIRKFNHTSGYNDIFIPAMRKLSPSYEKYQQQLEIANQAILEKYPEMEKSDK